MHKVNFKKWRVLSIPQRDTDGRIYFSTFDDDEYRLLIDMHKRHTLTDPVELAMDKIANDQDKKNAETIMHYFSAEESLNTAIIEGRTQRLDK